MGRFRSWLVGASVALAALGLPVLIAPSAGAVLGGGCNEYAPTTIAVSVPHAPAGATVTVSGFAVPGSTVDISIGQVTFQQIGTTVAGTFGSYSTSVTIPNTLTPGTYSIRMTSPGCPVQVSVSFVVDPGPPVIASTTTAAPTTTAPAPTTTAAPAPTTTPTTPGGGTCAANPTLVKRKQTVTFTLLSGFQTNKSVSLALQAQFWWGPFVTLYSGGYPGSGTLTVTIPNSAVDGQYNFVQSGTGLNGWPLVKSCGVKVQGTAPASQQSPTVLGEQLDRPVVQLASASLDGLGSSQSSTPAPRPLVALMLVVVAGASLVLLRVRRRA
jgi:hypothetical protein